MQEKQILESTRETNIETEYLMSMQVPGAGAPHLIDSSLRIHRAGLDGRVHGPKISGTIVQPTADWLRICPDGTMRVDARITIVTNDDAVIYASYNGIIRMSRGNFERMSGGETLTAKDMYFVIAPTFQTGNEKYLWLNQLQAVGKVSAIKGGEAGYVVYDLYAIR
ncbi:PF11578 family protein [Leptospira broomii serovar Hurstbridge str. 5399]|uniref:PF11578 family protein n=1 Tax=Leptospira broomii serovar Hurstbridge str. 5399 TaxID=1049789 RepID=T0F5S1_9LEPT|nr:DUF3237 domain-containing protein [Leptospira broomii]EQA43271.1 PF11578 family protein [Leptospira broomii serovar Hurstbridge str. 5399]